MNRYMSRFKRMPNTKFSKENIQVTKLEQKAVEEIKCCTKAEVESKTSFYILLATAALSKEIFVNIENAYKEMKSNMHNSVKEIYISITLFLDGKVIIQQHSTGYQFYNYKPIECYTFPEELVESDFWEDIQDVFIKESSRFFGVKATSFGYYAYPRAEWNLCIYE